MRQAARRSRSQAPGPTPTAPTRTPGSGPTADRQPAARSRRWRHGTAARQAEPAPTGSQTSSTGSAVAVPPGSQEPRSRMGSAAAKDRTDDRAAADGAGRQHRQVGRKRRPGRGWIGASDEQRPAGAPSAGVDDAPTGQSAPPEEHRAGVGGSSGRPPHHRRGQGSVPDRSASPGRTQAPRGPRRRGGSRPEAAEHADGHAGVGATRSPADADRGPAEAPAAGRRRPARGKVERSSTTWSADKTRTMRPPPRDGPGAWTAGAEPPAGERRGGE